jgi:UDP-N-acetylmuramate: L-alanyl-gamma-D-glutamyl-meso-diaminopimelate ligase
MKQKAQDYFDRKIAAFSDADVRVFDRITPSLAAVKSVHITGVCGTATASLGSLFLDAGITVTGSDTACYPPMSTILADLAIDVMPFGIKNLEGKDAVIVANMCAPGNEEAAYCRETGVPTLSMSEAIHDFFIRDKNSVVIAGTHGKTTTTGICVHVFESAKREPSFLVGGVMKNTGSSARYNADSKHFIIEGDEYDTAYFDKSPKFLHYNPRTVVVTSVELDHVDIYSDIEDYRNSFRFLIEEVSEKGHIFVCGETEGSKSLFEEYREHTNISLYGFDPSYNLCIKNIRTKPTGQEFEVFHQGVSMGDFFLPMFGSYNALNALAVIGVSLFEGLTVEEIKEGLTTFTGMKRRQEIYGEKNGITVIDDFAHHPTAALETLKGIRQHYPDRRIIALFEPRSNSSRSKLFEEEYTESFTPADMVVFSVPKPKDGYNPPEFMDTDLVIRTITEQGKEAYGVYNALEAVELLAGKMKSGDVVVVMSNGSFDGVHEKLLEAIK